MRGGEVTPERIRDLLEYTPETGAFVWRVRQSRAVPAGTVAGSVKSNGRRYISVDGQAHMAHRLAWVYVHGEWPAGYVRHRNEKFDDNWIANLYEATVTETNIDRRLGKNNTSGRVGVGFNTRRGKWKAWIKRDFRSVNIGWFDTFEDACAARAAAESEFPANVSAEEFERSSHHERTRQRQRIAWRVVHEDFGGDCVWGNFGAFIADVGEPAGSRYRVVKVAPELPIGPDNFAWLPPPSERFDMATVAGRNARKREIYRETNAKQKDYGLMSRYGLTRAERQAILEDQGGVCAICARLEVPPSDDDEGFELWIDHNHGTDEVRGLICNLCNSALGLFKDRIANLEAAIRYLKNPPAPRILAILRNIDRHAALAAEEAA